MRQLWVFCHVKEGRAPSCLSRTQSIKVPSYFSSLCHHQPEHVGRCHHTNYRPAFLLQYIHPVSPLCRHPLYHRLQGRACWAGRWWWPAQRLWPPPLLNYKKTKNGVMCRQRTEFRRGCTKRRSPKNEKRGSRREKKCPPPQQHKNQKAQPHPHPP
jgi:hypothetical protein